MDNKHKERLKMLGIILLSASLLSGILDFYVLNYVEAQNKQNEQNEQSITQQEELTESIEELEVTKYILSLEIQDKSLFNDNISIETVNGFYNSYEVDIVKVNVTGTKYTAKHPYNNEQFILIEFKDDKVIIYELDKEFKNIKTLGVFSDGNIHIKEDYFNNEVTEKQSNDT